MKFVKREIPEVIYVIKKYIEENKNTHAASLINEILFYYTEFPWAVDPIVVYVHNSMPNTWDRLGAKAIIFNNTPPAERNVLYMYPKEVTYVERDLKEFQEFMIKKPDIVTAFMVNNHIPMEAIAYTTGIMDFLTVLFNNIRFNYSTEMRNSNTAKGDKNDEDL